MNKVKGDCFIGHDTLALLYNFTNVYPNIPLVDGTSRTTKVKVMIQKNFIVQKIVYTQKTRTLALLDSCAYTLKDWCYAYVMSSRKPLARLLLSVAILCGVWSGSSLFAYIQQKGR